MKHKPKSLDEFVGKSAAEYVRGWDGRPLMVYGGPGSGKSLLAQLTAKEKGWDLVEVDDENIRDADKIASTSSLYGGRRLILVEDVDAMKDMKAVSELVETAKSPLLLTTQDYASRRLTTVKKKSESLQLRKPMTASVVKYLEAICQKEEVKADKAALEAVAKNAKGDLRAAVNDLETLCKGRRDIGVKDAEVLSERDVESDIYRALSIIFAGRDMKEVAECTWDLDEQPRDVLWWVDENIPLLYKDHNAIAESMHSLSRADIFLGRILNRQYWGFLRYANTLMTAGVNACRPEKINYTRYQFPGYFAALGRSKGDRNMEKAIAEKVSPLLHASSKIISREYIPLFRLLLKNDKTTPERLQQQFELTGEELEYLTA